MLSTKSELLSVLDKIQGLKILVAGDFMVDRYIFGNVERISPEAPVPIIEAKKFDDRLGGAGNVVRNLSELGVATVACGLVGTDQEGTALIRLLEQDRADTRTIIKSSDRPTTVKTRILGRNQQIARIDWEDRTYLSKGLEDQLIDSLQQSSGAVQCVIFSDYGKGALTPRVLSLIGDKKKNGEFSLNFRPLMIDPHPRNYSHYRGMTIAKPNRPEAEKAANIEITDNRSALMAATILREKWQADTVVITLGEDGLLILPESQTEAIFRETLAREVFDVSGAGDTVTAVFAAATAAGASPGVAGDLANLAAGIVVSEVGTVPITRKQLLDQIEIIFSQ